MAKAVEAGADPLTGEILASLWDRPDRRVLDLLGKGIGMQEKGRE